MQNMDMFYKVKKEDEGLTIKIILKKRLHFSSRLLRRLKQSESVYKNNESVFLYEEVKEEDIIRVVFPKEKSNFEPENINIDPVYEDQDLLIINKQPGIVVHPTKNSQNGTIANGLIHYMNKKNEVYKIRFVNRLDQDTSGLLIVGKNAFVQEDLSRQMKENLIIKRYTAIVEGILEKKEGWIHKPIKRIPGEIARVISDDGQPSITYFKAKNFLDEQYTVVELELKTGRTHQIRVHMSSLGHPVAGDAIYGAKTQNISRQALHAEYLSFLHPRHKERIEVFAEIPEDMQRLIDHIK